MTCNQHDDTKKIYDSIAEQYVEFKKASFRTAIEEYTLFDVMILPNEFDRINKQQQVIRILDLACGDGHYTRKLKERFPQNSFICGLDISSSMIDLANMKETQLQQGIKYVCADGKAYTTTTELHLVDQYDIVTSAFYLNYARTHDELRDMIRGIYIQLKAGGTFYSITDNICSPLDCYNNEKHKKYSFYREMMEDSLRDGMSIKFSYYENVDSPSSCCLYAFYISPHVYEQLFIECGFSSFQWIQAQCDPNYPDRDYFDDFFRYPVLIGIIAKK